MVERAGSGKGRHAGGADVLVSTSSSLDSRGCYIEFGGCGVSDK